MAAEAHVGVHSLGVGFGWGGGEPSNGIESGAGAGRAWSGMRDWHNAGCGMGTEWDAGWAWCGMRDGHGAGCGMGTVQDAG